MEWTDHGILLTTRRHGETAAIIELFTESHGRHAGVVRGGTSRRLAPVLQPGAQLQVTWRARLENHMGSFTVEPLRSRAATALSGRLALAGLNAVIALLVFALPDRQKHRVLYTRSAQLLDLLGQDKIWPLAYLRWELVLLAELGYGLDLGKCAVTGATEGLVFVSPGSGRAVTAAGAGAWQDKLLPLPPVLLCKGTDSDAEVAQALTITGYFLTHRVAPELSQRPLPKARQRFIEAFTRRL
ncbi:MAG: DNA repair protein RecO [Rhodobacteraceae bacterium]|nr:DNA repair protein RecO [Paracoccaceae bacterium]